MVMWWIHLDLVPYLKNAEIRVHLASKAIENQQSIKYLMTYRQHVTLERQDLISVPLPPTL